MRKNILFSLFVIAFLAIAIAGNCQPKQPSAKAARPVPEKNDGLIKYKTPPRMVAANVKLDTIKVEVVFRGIPNTWPDTFQLVRRRALAVFVPPAKNKPRQLLYIYLEDDPNTRVNMKKHYEFWERTN